MDSLKNVPTEPALLTELINAKKNQVVSMALSKRDDVTVSVFSFSDNEGISEEEYFGDTLYYVLEGKMSIGINGKTVMSLNKANVWRLRRKQLTQSEVKRHLK